MLGTAVRRLAKPLHAYLRGQKVSLALSLVGERVDSLLDLGGGEGFAGEFEPLFSPCARLVRVNLDPHAVKSGGRPGTVADARRLPFKDGAFEWVFSNAMLEHVGSFEDQRTVAEEIRRVARRGYFVATPNRYFPIEPHTLTPGYQFLPELLKKRLIRFTPGYMKSYERVVLLSRSQMRALFPEATVAGSGAPLLPTSLIAYWKKP